MPLLVPGQQVVEVVSKSNVSDEKPVEVFVEGAVCELERGQVSSMVVVRNATVVWIPGDVDVPSVCL